MVSDALRSAYVLSTAENLSEKGVHEVAQRRFVLVAAVRRNVLNTPILQTIKNGTLTNLLCFCSQDHPIVSAISENAEYGH